MIDFKKILEKLENHEARIRLLENASEKNILKNTIELQANPNYAGPKGGILLLVKKGFLKSKNTASVVKNELEKEGYVYKIQVVQTALNRLSSSKGPLVKIDENGKKTYVERK